MSNAHQAIGRLLSAPSMLELAHAVRDHSVVAASGAWGSSVAVCVAAIQQHLQRPVLLVTGHIDESDDLADDIELFTENRPEVLPALEVGGSLGRASEDLVSRRMRAVLDASRSKKNQHSYVASVQAIMQPVPDAKELGHLVRSIGTGQMLDPEKLIVWLSERGYNRLDQVEVPGDFAVRGGIIDLYIPGEFEHGTPLGLPVRLDFFGDQIESIKTFDPDTLGAEQKLNEIELVDLKGSIADSDTSFLTYLSDDHVIVWNGPLDIAEQSKSYLDRLSEQKGVYPLGAVVKLAGRFHVLELSQFEQGTGTPSLVGLQEPHRVNLPIKSVQRFETHAKQAVKELGELCQTHDVTVFCEKEAEETRLNELLEADAPEAKSCITLERGYLHRGFILDPWHGRTARAQDEIEHVRNARATEEADHALCLLGQHEIFNRFELRRKTAKPTVAGKAIDSFTDLRPGDYVVHIAHGIGKFTGMRSMEKEGKTEEYLTLRFADDAVLHVPAARINLIQKYVGGFTGHPNLSKLGSGMWEKQKARVEEAVMDMAAELIEVQAMRAKEIGTSFPGDTDWQREFEEEFPYTPTLDQATGSTEIKLDMQKPKPMDRLLCGDVGYGKTELAMRAAFKACEFGKQVAVLVPTTVLCEQHERSFRQRMAGYPFVIESVSRFKTSKHIKDVISRLQKGQVDVVIGTHRLLSKDVRFADLGLVVVDEEQKFGVTHKERLKQMRAEVDVLTMSATPIPRTLHMSLLGLRDITSLTTAPQDRRAIVTEVIPYDTNRIKMAIMRELQREGQVFFLHNRVHDILEQADQIQRLVPDARVIVGHGQMGEGELEKVMMKVVRHEADVLVATTIIESGLDIPNANTILINHADRFGLSELHQLRGRVGRYKHRAYCYLLLPQDRPVTDIAARRLRAIEEFSHLGAGFKIAMRDLELRGAGNILGPEQSGHIATVGYEMYCQLLEEAVHQIKKEPRPLKPEAHVDIGVNAVIPKSFIPVDRQRMDAYRRLTRCSSIGMLDQLKADLSDAFGKPPAVMEMTYMLTELRLLSGIYGVESLVKKDPDVVLTVRDATLAGKAFTGAPGSLRVIDEKTVYLRPPKVYLNGETLLMVLRNLLRKTYDIEKPDEVRFEKPEPAAV